MGCKGNGVWRFDFGGQERESWGTWHFSRRRHDHFESEVKSNPTLGLLSAVIPFTSKQYELSVNNCVNGFADLSLMYFMGDEGYHFHRKPSGEKL